MRAAFPTRSVLWPLLALVAGAGPASAELVMLREGEDVAPYQFLPGSLRGSNPSLWATTNVGHSFITYLRFDLPTDLVGPEETVGEATLTVFYANDEVSFGEGSDEPAVLECRPVLQPWSESTVTWLAQPGFGDPVDVIEGIEELGPLTFDVTGLVVDWVDGARPNHGFALTNPTARLMGFFSFEAQVDPVFKASLAIDVVPVPEPGAAPSALAALVATLALVRARIWRAAP
jgi:hypothetical protein